MEFLFIFSLGSLLYGLTEILWRGWTHWSMLICGGLCFSLMYRINLLKLPLLKKYILSSAAIITVEFYAGVILNLFLKLNVWDYSSMSHNILGQICPQFLFLWFLLSIPGIWLCGQLSRLVNKISSLRPPRP